MASTTTTPTPTPTAPTPGHTNTLTPADEHFLKVADHAFAVAKGTAESAVSAKKQGDALNNPALSAALQTYVDAVIAAAKTAAEERDAAHEAAKIPDPANIKRHAELARAAAERAVAAEKAALGIVIQVEMEVLAIASIERDFARITRLGLGDISPIQTRSRPYSVPTTRRDLPDAEPFPGF